LTHGVVLVEKVLKPVNIYQTNSKQKNCKKTLVIGLIDSHHTLSRVLHRAGFKCVEALVRIIIRGQSGGCWCGCLDQGA